MPAFQGPHKMTLKDVRFLRRKSQADLAKAIGVKASTVYLWESGKTQPRMAHRFKLGKELNLSEEEIYQLFPPRKR
jgi:DNA-binding XRE family transcriptional regulator